MARLIKCPKCQSQMDVTGVDGGSTVSCPDCNSKVRVPTGQTGQHASVKAGAAAKGGTRPGRTTPLFRKMQGARVPGGAAGARSGRSSRIDPDRGGTRQRRPAAKSNTGAIIGVVGGIVVLIIIIAIAASSGGGDNKNNTANNPNNNEYTGVDNGGSVSVENTPEPAKTVKKPDPVKKGPSGIKKTDTGGYDIPASFQPGASKEMTADGLTNDKMGVTLEQVDTARALLSKGRVSELIDNFPKYAGGVICNMIDDDETTARSAFQFMHDLMNKLGMKTEASGQNPIQMDKFNSAYYRASAWTQFSGWYVENKANLDSHGGATKMVRKVDPESADWNSIMTKLRAGGAFDEMDRPEGQAFATVKAMGRAAYPHLVKFIDHEDRGLGRAANTILNELTGRNTKFSVGNPTMCKREWEKYIDNN